MILYLLIQSNNNSPLQQAKLLSEEIQKISRPKQDVPGKYRYGWVTDGKSVYLRVNTDDMIPVGDGLNLTKLVLSLGNVSAEERIALMGYISSSNKVKFGHLIPSTSITKTYEQLLEENFFKTYD